MAHSQSGATNNIIYVAAAADVTGLSCLAGGVKGHAWARCVGSTGKEAPVSAVASKTTRSVARFNACACCYE